MSPSLIGVSAVVVGVPADEVFERIADFADFGTHVPSVDRITVSDDDPASGTRLSSWSVHFRGGLLQWVERDVVDRAERTVVFEQSSGDLGSFDGRWAVGEHEHSDLVNTGSRVGITFDAAVDIGIPSMADLLNPVAATELADGVHRIVDGLFAAGVLSVTTSANDAPIRR